ncbi:hypothetical protein GCM10029976_029080 [Kribbella albertanoniae]|uniref:ABC transporter permease n=1 Tax=Kribbella albertanoniae TaxID=1266829 RepID=A0A4R4NYH2_9ACTN|nr:ABC transporter permease [Kribbella albertanoniae]TDC14961.1 ABC transporter permease [Kribbella albertanoniae]
MNALRAELRKALSLPAVWAGLAVTLFGSTAIAVLNSGRGKTAFETALGGMPLGTVGAVVIGVVAFSHEYTANNADAGGGRQITTTLTVTPQRIRILLAKVMAIVLLVVGSAAVTLPVTIGITHLIVDTTGPGVSFGDAIARCLGGTLYWTLMALIAFAITVILRNGVIPLIVLIVNSSVVSVSFLLSKLTSLAFWLPDVAGLRLFSDVMTVEGALDAGPGGLVMTGWAVVFCVAAGFVFTRRDA